MPSQEHEETWQVLMHIECIAHASFCIHSMLLDTTITVVHNMLILSCFMICTKDCQHAAHLPVSRGFYPNPPTSKQNISSKRTPAPS